MSDRLYAISPLDGRYASLTEPLVPYASEAALMRSRTRVEVEYLVALADLEAVPLALSGDHRAELREIYTAFDREDAGLIKRIETEGYGEYPATNHDVKAVEYFLRARLPEDLDVDQWIHFGLTSEDVNNLAQRLLLKAAIADVIRPTVEPIRRSLAAMATAHRDLPMLSRTHGQPATPTTFGKELAVYASRLDRSLERLDAASDGLAGKLAGATGTYAAQATALPDVDWRAFARAFVTDLGLEHVPLTTQVNPCDDLATLFDALRGINNVIVDLDRDAWLYVSRGYLGQESRSGETGSSTMPHKVNPIDFENSEGNLSKANADLVFLADYVTTSRLQRDLSDSTVKRTIGGALAHSLIGYARAADGIGTVVPNETAMREDLEANPAVLAEAFQTVLRREGLADAYERVKMLTRGEEVSMADFRDFVESLDVAPEVRDELLGLSPEKYTGLASDLVDELGDHD